MRKALKASSAALLLGLPILSLILAPCVAGQTIEFLSNGLKYQALTREGLTIMYAPLHLKVRNFAVMQVAFNNGSGHDWLIQPTDFYYKTSDGRVLRAVSEYTVIYELYQRAGRSEVIKLQMAYEKSIYNNQHIRSNNGYEQRRQSALGMGGHGGIKAAAAASAIALVRTKLKAGDSTDGAVFFINEGKELGAGSLTAQIPAIPDQGLGGKKIDANSEKLIANLRKTTFNFGMP